MIENVTVLSLPLEVTRKKKVVRPGKIGSYYMTVYFSPAEEALGVPIGFMARTTKTLDIAIYSISHPEIVQAVIDCHARGVKVRMVVDRTQAGGKYVRPMIELLEQSGVPLIRDCQSGIMHDKYAISDEFATLTGSFNWTRSAVERNRENQVVLRMKKQVQGFVVNFQEIWEANGGLEVFPDL